ncbi:Nn.00g047650.m01.CDS01 [Neocucurbitaria sp. VM-36]
MVYPLFIGSTLLRTQRLTLPHTFCRYKSITAAIERGRQGGPDRPSRPGARVAPEHTVGGRAKTRREERYERFGPPREQNDSSGSALAERPQRGRDEKVTAPRSSRFGRVGPPRPRDAAPSRFRDERPQGVRERKPFPDCASPGREQFGADNERTSKRERTLGTRDDRAFDRGKSFDRPRTSYSDRAGQRGAQREEVGHDQKEYRSRWSERPSRSTDNTPYIARARDGMDKSTREPRFSHRPDSKGARREQSGREQTERYYPHDSSRTKADSPSATNSPRNSVRGPESLPYTTAASEFIYGYSSVLAAIKANRRKFYRLYVHSRGASRDGLMARVRAHKLFPITEEVGDEYMRALDKASSGRPHNGVILESSPLPVPPITELKTASVTDESFSVAIDSQSAEDALVNGKQELYPYKSAGWRHPLILYVDGVLDEGNLGAIARSAYFLGVDAIITPTRQTAPWSHIALKASAGAAEAIPLFKVGEPTDFLGKSSRAGWRIYASDAIPPVPSISVSAADSQDDGASKVVYTIARSAKRLSADHCPVAEHPTILMMGAEGTGLRSSLLNLAHYKVGIPHGREIDEVGVDSLNVSVAASLLCYEMLQKPKSQPIRDPEEILF